jgi:hypothetical protein
MKELIERISAYHLFNYLFPGILFAVIANVFTTYNFIQDNVLEGIFIYYFIGLTISRIGSLIIEPLLRKFSFVNFSEYKKYVSASNKDPKVELLSEMNNMFRTIVSTFVVLLLLKGYNLLEIANPQLENWTDYILIVGLFVLFLFAYRKQSAYISERIKSNRG